MLFSKHIMAEEVSKQEWGRAFLRIQDAFPVQEHAAGSGIYAFYLANKTTTMLAIARAVEGHPDVRMGGVEENFLLVPVFFYSQLGYQYFTSILKGRYLQECLQNELEQLEYKGLIIGCGERWELPNLPEGEVGSWELVSMGTRGIIEDKVMSWLDVTHDISDKEDVEEEAGPPKAKKARLHQQPPVQEGPLKRLRAKLQQHKDSPTAKTRLDACSCLERGAVMLTSGGYQEGEGVEHLLEGLMLMEYLTTGHVNRILYGQSWLHLNKPQLDKLISKQLHSDPDSTPCLLIQALQLPLEQSRQQAINHVIDTVLQHGETDPMYKNLAYIYCALGFTIWQITSQPAPALSAYASALMYKSDYLLTLFYTSQCSMHVSVPQAIRQFHHFIHTAPTCHPGVPCAHYTLVILYDQQDPSIHRDKIPFHYNMAQQTDRNRLPVFGPVSSALTDRAKRVYEQVMAHK